MGGGEWPWSPQNGGAGGLSSAFSSTDGKDEKSAAGSVSTAAVVRNGGSIAERRAARCGFNPSRLNTPRFRCDSPLGSPAAVCSPYLTIPPGISPSSLLVSPVMLSNSLAQPSPTTGTFPLPTCNQKILSASPVAAHTDVDNLENLDSSFITKPHVDPISMPNLWTEESQSQVQMQMQIQFDGQACLSKEVAGKSKPNEPESRIEGSDNAVAKAKSLALQTGHPGISSDQTPQLEEQPNRGDTGLQQHPEGDQTGTFPPIGMGRPSEDGYNWRKYGQKQVKGSEYPRSYYKCTHPNCQVKKKVERSHDGQITEIIYKGAHNHPKPQPSRRSAIGSAFLLDEMSDTTEGNGSFVKTEGGSIWRSTQQGSKDNGCADWRTDGMETSSSIVTELSDTLSSAQGKHLNVPESSDTPELSYILTSYDDDDGATQGSMPIRVDDEDDESESKRRKKDSSFIETSSAARAVREPRIVVQTVSEVDILEDGYRWRKYGQKVVKGNPNPRSYYKCTNPGCCVRKHVERASHDLKSVITTYEGKHNHEVPVARSSSHSSSGSGSMPPSSNAQISMPLPRATNIPKPEPDAQDLAPQFERKLELSSEYFKPGYLGDFTSDKKLGVSSCYKMKFPPLDHLSFPPLEMNASHRGAHQLASVAHAIPEIPISLPTCLQRPPNLALAAGFDINQGRPTGPVVQSLFGQQPKQTVMKFFRQPKQEQKDDGAYDTQLPTNNLANASIYCQTLGGFPL